MSGPLTSDAIVGVVGAGTMGAGIAQVAAGAGHRVLLYDAMPGAAERGRARILERLAAMVSKDRLTAPERDAIAERIALCTSLDDFVPAGLVVEAVVEDVNVKRELLRRVEEIVDERAILATNTSSISVTALAAVLRRPGAFAGLHFFNPAPVMKLVEVVSGLATRPDVAAALVGTAERWGKIAIRTRSTPGFVVNRVARPYYGEALRLLEEQVTDAATIDALLTEGAGFRMGPFALMDLIGNDVNFAVSRSVFEAYHQDPRYRPSILQKELVDAGWYGRKSGRGFYTYALDAPAPAAAKMMGSVAEERLTAPGAGGQNDSGGVVIALSDGRTAASRARALGRPVLVHDLAKENAGRLGFAASADVPRQVIDEFVANLAACGTAATNLPDWPGLVVMRTVAMLANEAFEVVLQGVADEAGVDLAMRHGMNFPRGPIEWARRIGLRHVLDVIDSIFEATHDPRYRASFALRRQVDVL